MREKLLMNRDWLYFFGEPEYPQPKPTSGDQTYRGSRAENARGPARRDFDDRKWKVIQLPYDFVYANGQPEDGYGHERGGFTLDRGSAWYRRYFRINEADREKRITLLFDGVSTKCEVYVNSILLKTNHTAGIGFEVDITDVARFNTDLNVVSVHADCHDYEAWYYEGGGIYRNVYLCKTANLAVALWGTFVKPTLLHNRDWNIDIETELYNNFYEDKTAEIISRILDPNGNVIMELTSAETTFPLQVSTIVKQNTRLSDPSLWDPDHCDLYELKTEVVLGGEVVDTYSTSFGIREITFDPDNGMFVNGRHTTVYGFANHQFYLGVGNALSDSMREYQIRTIKEMGANGYRTVHSPHAPDVYDYCDRYGLLVMDENRIFHSSDITISEVERMIKRDRNHPSLLVWSLFNEEDTLTHETGKRIFRRLAAVARKLDPTRPISGATSFGIFTADSHDDHDLIGINHQTQNFEELHAAKPDKPIYSSEMSGMNYVFGENQPYHDITNTLNCDYVVGGYVFTAWGYSAGIPMSYDAMGFPEETYYLHLALLKPEEKFVKVWPDWDRPDQDGAVQRIRVISSADKIELFLNGKSLGVKESSILNTPIYKIPYDTGELKAVAWKDGNLWAEEISKPAGKPVGIQLKMENLLLESNNDDVAIITAILVDSEGRMATSATGYPTTFSCNAAGELIGAISPRKDEYQIGWSGPETRFCNGRCQAFFRSLALPGDLIIAAESEGLPKAELVIKRSPVSPIPAVASEPSNYVLDWQISPLILNSLDREQIIREHLIERWEHIDLLGAPDVFAGCIPMPQFFGGGGPSYPPDTAYYCVYHAYSTVPEMGDKNGKKLSLVFEGIEGNVDIVVAGAGRHVYGGPTSESPWPGHYRQEHVFNCDVFKPGDEVEIWGFVDGAGRLSGITWPVRWSYCD